MDALLFHFPGNETLADALRQQGAFEKGELIVRRFPDGESYLRILSEVAGRRVVLLCTLLKPDEKALPLYFFARQVKLLGASSVILLAPYLAYMRQDKAFHPGEAVTSDLFARLLSEWYDALITVDPHLHRHHQLSEIYRIPARALHAGLLLADYIRQQVSRPVLIGPDAESKQWVVAVAQKAGCDFEVLRKERFGDREVRVSLPQADRFAQHTPVLVDDIISTGRTMTETIRHLREAGLPAPVCIGVHGIFAGQAWEEMKAAGARDIVTCNTIPHPSNAIDISRLLIEGLKNLDFAG